MFIGCLAALDEAVQHVDLAVETADDVGDFLAEDVDLRDEFLHVVDAGDEDLVFDGFGFGLDGAGEWFETVDDVVSVIGLARGWV